ncbi:MAG: recombinase family protein [Eubacteriales bacterium]|nr:recombinase family protein [Eubacteriales bacterium]
MARTSKKKSRSVNDIVGKAPQKVYSVGIYARLSVDSNERKNESIDTQIEIAKKFVQKQSDMVLYRCYSDLGKTGTTFEREGFEQMMQDVRMRKIDCIVVKDLSRFGRNHIEAGNYIEKIFPFMGVRFIAVTDNFDSMNISGQNEMFGVNLKNLSNEMYARDIAVKVKASRLEKWASGSFTGGVGPYGYRAEWVGKKKCLLVEETTSDIVRQMFEMYYNGSNMKEIARWLYDKRINRPTEYQRTGNIYCPEGDTLLEWSQTTIKLILTNPAYIGHLVQGRTCGKDYMMRDRHDIDSEDWSVKENTHEAIISEDIFFGVAAKFRKNEVYRNKKDYKPVPIKEDIYKDILYCGDCGARMHRISAIKTLSSKDKVRTYSYNCKKIARIDEEKCITKSITLHALNDIVKEAIRQEFALSAMRQKDLIVQVRLEAAKEKEELEADLLEVEKKIEQVREGGSEQYLRYRMGELESEEFQKCQEDNKKMTTVYQTKREEISGRLRTLDYETTKKEQFLRALIKGKGKDELTLEVIQTLIHRIEVFPDHRLKVIFKFKRRDVLPTGQEVV